MERAFDLIGHGLYSVPEARRLTKVPPATINRWVRGYARRGAGERVEHPPIVKPELPKIDEEIALSFRDLMELRFISKLRRLDVPWREIKETVDVARDLFKTPHPFGTRRFRTDGQKVFAKIGASGALMRRNQLALEGLFDARQFVELEYEGEEVARWRPEAGAKAVILDPLRSFGKPLLDKYDIPTSALSAAVRAEESIERVADWFDVPANDVKAAVDYEQYLQAA